jgi:predicted GNAT family acetyltransferase
LAIIHDKKNQRFTLAVNTEVAFVEYTLRDSIMYLVHSEVPSKLRGQSIGKLLVELTFEKLTEENYSAVAVCSYIKMIKNRSDKWRNIIA